MNMKCVIVLLIGMEIATAAVQAQALVLYTEPPSTYLNALEVRSITPANVVYSQAVLPNGQKAEIPRAGIVAVIAMPPQTPTFTTETEATNITEKIRILAEKYPQYRAKLDSALMAWNEALADARQHASTVTRSSKTAKSGPDLEVDGTKYHDVALLSFNGAEIGISHADGAATIPATKLTGAQIAVLNATTTSVRITPSEIKSLHAKAASANPDPQSPAPASIVNTPDDDREISRLKGAVVAAEANLKNLQAEQAALTVKHNATPNSLRSSPEFQEVTRRENAVHAEIQQAQIACGDATANLREGERAILSKELNATVDAYRVAATLPAEVSDWAGLEKKWSDEVAGRAQSARAADEAARTANSTARNTPEAVRLNLISDAEEKKLQLAKTTLQIIQTRIVEADRQTQAQKQQMALDQQQSAEQAKIGEMEKQFRALPAVTDTFVEPKLPVDFDPPTFAETIEFINSRSMRPNAKIGFGEQLQKVIYRDEANAYVFDPADLNPDVKYSKGGGPNAQHSVLLECRNHKPLIQHWMRGWAKPLSGWGFEIPTGDDIDTEKMATALSHLITMFGGKKEAF